MRDDAIRWNRRYAHRGPGEPTAPIGADLIGAEMSGRCLDVACGAGEHAVWAALNGFDVVALDISAVAVELTRQLARQHGVAERIDARVCDLDDGLPSDVLGAHVVISQRFRDPDLYSGLIDALAPGGTLLLTVLSEVGLVGEPGAFHAPGRRTRRCARGLRCRDPASHRVESRSDPRRPTPMT